jgi:hypothetical protein
MSPYRRAVAYLGLIVGLAMLAPISTCQAAEAAMSVRLPAGKWKSVRLRSLPKDAVMAVVVQTTGAIGVGLLSEADYRRFPSVRDPVFFGAVDRRLSFTVTIPEAGNYYLVLDNRRSQELRNVKFLIRARRGPASDLPAPEKRPPANTTRPGEVGT